MNFSPFRLSLQAIIAVAAVAASCSSVDCPLNNKVLTNYALLDADGRTDTMRLAMTVSTNRTDGSDSVLINKDQDITKFSLPISNAQPRDSFFVELTDGVTASLDTIVVDKEDMMHFESTDCAASYFHKIKGVTTTHHAIDSVAINYHNVDYDTSKTHFHIYFSPRH